MLKNSKLKTKLAWQRAAFLVACLLALSSVACVSPLNERGDPTTIALVETSSSMSASTLSTSSSLCAESISTTESELSDASGTTDDTSYSTAPSSTEHQPTSSRVARTSTSRTASTTTSTRRSTTKTAKSTSTKQSTTKTTASNKVTVTFIVECRNAVQRKHEFPGLEDKIDYMIEKKLCSPNGNMLKKTATFPRGTTVYDALLSLPLNVTVSTFNPGYIAAIGGLAEKEAGSYSGWVFLINGVFSMKGSTQCVLKNGDVIHWGYTIQKGDVK